MKDWKKNLKNEKNILKTAETMEKEGADLKKKILFLKTTCKSIWKTIRLTIWRMKMKMK
jgi:hypothetical protein